MKYLLPLFSALTLLTFGSQNELLAQKPYKGTSITISAGVTSPYTDIRQHQFYRSMRSANENQPVVGIVGKQMINHVFGFTADAHIGTLQGCARNVTPLNRKTDHFTEDVMISQRLGFSNPVKFRTNFKDAAISLYTNWTNLGMYINSANMKNDKPRKYAIYSSMGIGMINYGDKTKKEVSALYSNMPVPASEIYYLHGDVGNTTETMFPVAIGAKYRVAKAVDLGLEYSHRFVMNDKLDGVINNSFVANPKVSNKYALANTRWQGGNDAYALWTLNLTYNINGEKPGAMVLEWTNPMEVMLKSMDSEMAKMHSLMNDSDKDGVSDLFDKEPNTPAGVKVDGSGTALDVDYDGVADFKDDELYSPKGSTVNEVGVAADGDEDGVPDVKDMEPNSSKNALVNFRGVTIGGRSETKSTEGKTVFVFPAVYFDLNSDVVKPMYHDQLADVARNMIKYPELKINIFGNADTRGSDKFNESLGKRRAENVAAYIRKNFNIDASKILMIESYGKSRPISTLHTPNRRVDIMMAD